jgi:hypothetical protein
LSLNKKVTKEVSIGEALMSPPGARYTLSYVPLPWRAIAVAQQMKNCIVEKAQKGKPYFGIGFC